MSAAVYESRCPICGEPVSRTVTTGGAGDQLASDTVECPSCRAQLVRAIDGPADLGWRLAEG
jgi:endogenous inhibitor of DNA gyrase (YacG/DUF329 family)